MKDNRETFKFCRVEYAPGTIMWWKGREIEVVHDTNIPGRSDCEDCVLRHSRTCLIAIRCHADERRDGIGVHFENVRKEERI